MNFRYFLFIVLLASMALGAACQPGFTDSFQIRVLDAKSRPIEGAVVHFSYQISYSFGSKYGYSKPLITDANGLVSGSANNQEQVAAHVDCTIKYNASAGGGFTSGDFIATQHANIIDAQLTNVYKVEVKVQDHLGFPIENATIALDSTEKTSNSNGVADLYMSTGEYKYLVNYLDGKQAGQFTVADDTKVTVSLEHHSVTIYVRDDYDNPLDAKVGIFGSTFNTDSKGVFHYNKTFGSDIPYTIDYKGVKKSGRILPSLDNTAWVYYDLHAPVFGNITKSEKNGFPKLSIPLSDPGSHATGVNGSSVAVRYTTDPKSDISQWDKATVYTVGKAEYGADFPKIAPDTVVLFRAEAKDDAGNRATIEGRFVMDPAPSQGNTTTPDNTTTPHIIVDDGQDIPFLYIIVGVIIILLVVYMLIRIMKKDNGGEEDQ